MDLPLLDPIVEAMHLKLKLEHIESDFAKSKEQIEDIIQIHMNEIKDWIEAPLTSHMRIDIFLQQWEKIKKREIESLISKVEVHLEHAQYQDI